MDKDVFILNRKAALQLILGVLLLGIFAFAFMSNIEDVFFNDPTEGFAAPISGICLLIIWTLIGVFCFFERTILNIYMVLRWAVSLGLSIFFWLEASGKMAFNMYVFRSFSLVTHCPLWGILSFCDISYKRNIYMVIISAIFLSVGIIASAFQGIRIIKERNKRQKFTE